MTMQAGGQTCPRCGMTQDRWRGNGGQGVRSGGQTYCCLGCADDAGCTCK